MLSILIYVYFFVKLYIMGKVDALHALNYSQKKYH